MGKAWRARPSDPWCAPLLSLDDSCCVVATVYWGVCEDCGGGR